MQSGVLKMLAHDLRTPIAAIKLTVGLIDANDFSNKIIDCCDNTLLMMDDLLSHIQMSSEAVSLQTSETLVEEEIKNTCL